MKKQAPSLLIAFFVLGLFVFAKEPQAAPYYEGKVVKLIVGHGVGGGYDRMARLLSKYIAKYIPGKPAIVVENMVGGGGIIGANHIYNIAKPDGLTIGTFDRGLTFAQLLKAPGLKFDLTKYCWIGSPSTEATVFALRSDLPYKTFDDLRKKNETIYVAGAGSASTEHLFNLFLKEFLKANFKVVTYPSTPDSWVALERKEVDGKAGAYSSLMPYIARGLVRPLIRGRVSEKGIENLPVDEDLTTDKRGKAIMAMRSAGDLIGRPYVAPPKTPPDIINILQDALGKLTKDPEFIGDAKKNMMSVEYVPPEECLKVLNEFFNQPDDIVEEFRKHLKF